MIGASKILTVSYGTFSCTLEGFDEPFNTMKAIAEYFRDLAAEDRYFGAEPPTPDAAMLHRIAERAIHRRVEAKIQDNGVHLRAAEPDSAAPHPPATAPALSDAAPAATSAVAKLSLIRAAQVASLIPAAEMALDPAQSYTEDEHADDMLARLGSDKMAVIEAQTEAAPDVQLAEDVALADAADDADDFRSDLDDLAALDRQSPDSAGVKLDQPAAVDEQLAADIATESDQPGAEAPESDSIFLAALGAMIDPTPESVSMADDGAETATHRQSGSGSDDAGVLQRARARVIKVRRRNAGVAATVATSVEAQLVAAVAVPAPAMRGLLSDEAEAALQAELAALEFEDGPGQPRHETTGQWDSDADLLDDADAAAARPATDLRKRISAESGDDAVTRLMAQTNSVMDGPDIRRRQSAISHLKAAVAATVAERQLEGSEGQSAGETRSEPYRDDLDRAVRPRGMQTATSNDAPLPSGNTERPSPLVLVSEQRINRPNPAPQPLPTPARVRPRRVASSNLALHHQEKALDALNLDGDDTVNLFAETRSFAEFAENLGAKKLPDIMEAAAVYCVQVLQCPQFTRPQLLNQLSTLPGAGGGSLEDYLRSFGELLRQGRIVRLRRGQFALTDSSPYLRDRDRTAG